MKKLKNILVGIDYSKPSLGALRVAARCAEWDRACLTALHVIEEETLEDLPDDVVVEERSILEHAQGRLGDLLEETLGEDSGVYFDAVIGYPIEQFVLAAERIHADLIVLGSHGQRSADPCRIGVLADRCLRKAKQNVLLVHDDPGRPFERIVACIDFSDNSRRAARQAIHVAQQDGAALEFLHVFRTADEVVSDPSLEAGISLGSLATFDNKYAAAMESKMDRFVRPLLNEVGRVEHTISVVGDSSPRAAIVDRLTETKADLVVLGTRGKTTLKNLLLGSTAEKVLHSTSCSALVIKPEGFEYTID